MAYRDYLGGLEPGLLRRIDETQSEIDWVRTASGSDLLNLATDQLGLKELVGVADKMTAEQLGNLPHESLRELFQSYCQPGTGTADVLADQVQLCRAFNNPRQVTETIAGCFSGCI